MRSVAEARWMLVFEQALQALSTLVRDKKRGSPW